MTDRESLELAIRRVTLQMDPTNEKLRPVRQVLFLLAEELRSEPRPGELELFRKATG